MDDAQRLLERLELTNERLREEIAERTRAECTARISEERLKLALDIVNLGTWDWDIVSNVVVWSDNVEAIHGLRPGSFDGRYESWLALVHPDDRERVDGLVIKALGDGVGQFDDELRINGGDGVGRWLRSRGQVYLDEAGSPVRMVGTVVDVSERRKAEEDLRRARDEAEQARAAAEAASAAKNAFLSRMSHELRTPLNAVLGFSQLLEMDGIDAQRESLEHIRKAGGHLLALINEVLDITRIEAGELALSLEPVLVSEMVAETLDLIRPLADARRLTVAPVDETALGGYVVADRQRLKQVLLNLLSNAVKYNRLGGRIAVTLAPAPDHEGRVGIAVHDTGLGIAADQIERLFLPFDRLGAERSDIEGTGVGLTVAQRLAEVMAGEITVASRPGHGSVFTLTLPVAASPEASGEREVAAYAGRSGATVPGAAEAPGNRWNLLSIEDNPSNARLLAQLVARRPGWQLTSAAQGRLGLQLAASLRASSSLDLVLLDLHLPDLHGVEVLRRLRADPLTARTPVVVLSADATPGAVRRAEESGASAYLTKPFIAAELLGMLDSLARRGTLEPGDLDRAVEGVSPC